MSPTEYKLKYIKTFVSLHSYSKKGFRCSTKTVKDVL